MTTKQYHYPVTARMDDDFDFHDDHNFVYVPHLGAYISPGDGD